MCPLDSDEMIIYKDSRSGLYKKNKISVIYDNLIDTSKTRIFICNGKEIKATINRFKNNEKMLEIELVNGHKIRTTKNHLNLAFRGDIKSSELTVNDYLPFSRKSLPGHGLTYEDGIVVGSYLGDGSCKDDDRSLIKEFVIEENSKEKGINLKALNMSEDFRRGIIDSLCNTDGGNENRIYTSSINLRNDLVSVYASLGISTRIDEDSRRETEGKLSDSIIYCIIPYLDDVDFGKKNLYTKDQDYTWFKIKSIKEYTSLKNVYCLEVLDDNEPIFMMANGIVTHNCRLRLDKREIHKRGGGLFGANPATGSIGVVTINLAQIGYLAKNKEDLFSLIKDRFEVCVESLEIKRKIIEKNTDNGLYPYFARYHKHVKERAGQWFANHFSTIGVNGANEMCLNFLNKGIVEDESRILCEEVLDFINSLARKTQEETGNMYNIEATPAEGTSHRLALVDKKSFPDIITSGDGENVYYTGATLLPADATSDPIETAIHQNELQTKYSSGTVTHFFFGEKIDPENLKEFLKTIVNDFKIPYISFTPTFSVCQKDGYIAGEHFICPKCGGSCEVWSRVVGFYRPVQDYNKGKKAEYFKRKTYLIK